MNTRLTSALIMLGLLAVWALGGWLLFRGAFARHRVALASRTWPGTRGTITKSQPGTSSRSAMWISSSLCMPGVQASSFA